MVVPTLSTGCSLIAISTISADESNFLSKLVSAKDGRGNPLFNVLNLKMVCDNCHRRGLDLQCRHMLGQLPAWQSRGRHDFIQRVMETEEDTFLVEMRGILSDGSKRPAYDAKSVRKLMTDPTMIYRPDGRDIRHIFMSVDPAAGGERSEYAVVSAFFDEADRMILCGAEAGKFTDFRGCTEMAVNHITALRTQIPGAKHARFVFVPESNLAFEAQHIADNIRRAGDEIDFVCMREDANRAGYKTTREFKDLMVASANGLLVRDRVLRMHGFVCASDANGTPEEIEQKLLTQIRDYQRKVKPPRDLDFGVATVTYSGKDIGCDDLAIAFMALPLFKTKFNNDSKYWGFH